MKKISGFMAAVLVFVAVAVAMGPAQEAQAFSQSEIEYSDYKWYTSAKAGTSIYFWCDLEYETAESLDVTGWKAALCPSNNVSLDAAAATFELSNADKQINNDSCWASLAKKGTLASDIPEGVYKQAIFDRDGNLVKEFENTTSYINKSLVSFECSLMNNDGYAYAYVYSENLPLSAATYPTFYAADKTTAVTSFNDYAVETNRNGYKVHIYRLNILDASQFTLDSNGYTYLYYKVGTPNVDVSVSGNDAGNDGGIGLYCSDTNGFDWISAYNVNDYVQRHEELGYEVTNPFDKTAVAYSDDDDDDDDDDDTNQYHVRTAAATVGDQKVSVSVTSIQNSEVPAVQSAINNVVNWTSQIATKPAEVVKILNQYAPSMKIEGVTAGGTLDLAVPAGTDISSGARITFSDENISANVKSGDKIVVLHIKHDGSIEYIPAEAGDGTITATFTSLSPVAWFKVSASGSNNSISPKTGLSFWNFLMDLFR
ncbi:MAG: hypothetical protein ACI4AB_11370 [Acetatifactor sp.]